MFMMWVLHVICFFVFFPALVITIPFHLVLCQMEKNREPRTEEERKEKRRKESADSDVRCVLGIVAVVIAIALVVTAG